METIKKILENKLADINEIYTIYKEHKGNKDIESMIAMNLSMRTSVYDTELEKSPVMNLLLENLAYSQSMEARWAVAKNPHTPSHTLQYLALDAINLVRALVATNPNTPVNELNNFFSDEKIVRDGLSGNPKTPHIILKELARDEDKMVRLRVAENPSTSKEILEELTKDTQIDIQKAAKAKLSHRE